LQLPGYLSAAIEEITTGQQSSILKVTTQLSGRYKGGDFSTPALRSAADRAAYVATRFPATFAAATGVLHELRRLAPKTKISSMLDLGAGPGTALFAAAETIPSLQEATLFEADAEWMRMGKHLAAMSPFDVVRRAKWVQRDLQSSGELPQHDLVIISYMLGELSSQAASDVMTRAWKSARSFLIIVEPGTVRGFGYINRARTSLIASGAEILAPCPHKNACPMAEAGDWCHFAQRVERTSLHRRAKGGSLGYEDEKFSYVIASRLHLLTAAARIVRHPQKHSGHVKLELCTHQGLQKKTVTKSNNEPYKLARRAQWGDDWRD
jgi:ribosomal protein RSM22 (predicted rRNA methylase)